MPGQLRRGRCLSRGPSDCRRFPAARPAAETGAAPPRRGGRRWALWTVIPLGALGLAVVVAISLRPTKPAIILPPAKPAIILPPAKPAVVLPPAKTRLLYSIPWQDVRQGFPAHIYTTGISSDGRLFFGAGDAGPTGAIRVFDLATGKQVQEFLPDGDLWFTVAQFLPSGKYLVASYSLDKDLYLWDVGTGKLVRKFIGHTENGSQFAISPDGKRLLSWGDDKTVRLWDVDTGKELRKLKGHTDKAAGVFSPDGKQVLTFSPDKTLRLWDVESGKELQKLEGHTDSCTGCFSPDGKQALSYGPDGTIRLWDLGTGKEVQRFEGPTGKVAFAGFVAGGRLVVGRSEDQKYRVWEAASGKLVSEIDYAQYGGDGGSITAAPDGRHALVNVKDDGSVRVLDLPSGKETYRYDACPAARAFSFSPDGTLAVAGSFRAGMYVFHLPWGKPANP
jgi:WD40 repeat protein